MKWYAMIIISIGYLICGLNFYLSFIRYLIYTMLKGKKEDYKFISGIPLVGTLWIAVMIIAYDFSSALNLISLIFIALDTGGPHWFIFVLVYDKLKDTGKPNNEA